MTKRTQLDQIKADILKQNVCPDLAKQATQLVFGTGDTNTDIVFIGEAPGKKEDETGQPFVGASGKFLDEMLATIGLERSNIYITNIVKYRPPKNRDPSVAEKTAFWPFLQAQLDVIKPKVIITLGRHSMECFLPGLKISQVHGEPQHLNSLAGLSNASAMQGDSEARTEPYEQYGEGALELATPQRAAVVVLPLYHPAAALYNGKMRQTLIDDFAKIPDIIKLYKETS